MQQQKTFTQFFYKYIYLLIAAAWLITLSFIIDNYWSGNSSVEAVHKRLEKHIWQQETDFAKTVSDTSVVKKIQTKFYNDKLLESFINKKYFFYCYKIDETNNVNLVFWNSQVVLPTTSILNATDNIGFMQLPNGYYIWQKVKKENEIFIALIPIQWNYFVKNEYLQNTFRLAAE
ncbi:MAG: hypothetical protein IPP48_10950 [Chitinophagaceae bacterium]|nr:hypothetical protein [Chitinophagaceae bacterium]